MPFAFEHWISRFDQAVSVASAMGGERCELTIGPPASDSDVADVERTLGRALPPSFRRVLLDFSGAFALSWFLPDLEPPEPLQIFCGTLSWSVERLIELDEGVRGWVREVFPDPENTYDRVWHSKLGFHEVGNGDYLAVDVGAGILDGPVTYLSHDDGEGHGYQLGTNFIDAVERLSRVGCVGAEDWQWLPFTSSPTSGIDPYGVHGRSWREWFGLTGP